MKNLKLSLVAVLTLVGWWTSASDSQAFGLCRDRCCRYGTYICCRPYNAFTPVCFGTITCNGCAPVMMQPPCTPQCGGWMPGYCGPQGCCYGPNFSVGDGYAHGLPVPMPAMMPQQMPQGPMAQQYAPMPMQPQAFAQPQMPNLHTVGYQPGYQVPGYYVQPVSYYPQWPNQPVVPNYWYGR